jgi:hypothetical protein
MFRTKGVQKIKTHFVFCKFCFQKLYCLWDNKKKSILEPCKPQIIWYELIACWITKTTNTHLEYVRIIFPLQQHGCTKASHCYAVSTASVLTVGVVRDQWNWTVRLLETITVIQLMLHICGVSKPFGEWYQKTHKTEDTNKLTLLAFKTIAILHNTRLATFIKLLETVSKGLFRNRSQNTWQLFCDRFLKIPLLTVSRSFMNVANPVLWKMAIILKANKVNLFVSSALFVFWYHSPNFFDTPHIWSSL